MKTLLYTLSTAVLILTSCGDNSNSLQQQQGGQRKISTHHLQGKKNIQAISKPVEIKKLDYKVLSGEAQLKDSTVSIVILPDINLLRFEISLDLGEDFEFPKAYDSFTEKTETADYLLLKMSCSEGRKQISSREEKESSSGRKVTKTIQFDVNDFTSLKEGKHTLKMVLSSQFQTFFGSKSKNKPFQDITIQFDFDIAPIYKTIVHFKTLELNHTSIWEVLAGNDASDATPEAGISIKNHENSNRIIYGYSKNSFIHNVGTAKAFYHTGENPLISISAIDADYFLNPDDIISDTLVHTLDLQSKTYVDLKLKHTDKLLIKCSPKGRVN